MSEDWPVNQNNRKPPRRQVTTVSGLTMTKVDPNFA